MKEILKVITKKEFWIGIGMTTIYSIMFYSISFVLVMICNMGIEYVDIVFERNIEITQPILYISLFTMWVGLYCAISKYYYPTSLILRIFLKVITFGIYNYEIEDNYEDEENLEEIYENVINFKDKYEILKK